MSHASKEFVSLNCAILTVSDTRDFSSDTSGEALQTSLQAAGHQLFERAIVKDSVYDVRAVVSQWVAHAEVNVILITGGTGFSQRDVTPEAVLPLFDKTIEGFGEIFRAISFNEIGNSTVQSRAIAGLANQTVIFAMPGSTNACNTAWDGIIKDQLDARHKPCNFVAQLLLKAGGNEVIYCNSRASSGS